MARIAAEIISIGNELLSGTTLNSNSAFISRKLSEIGFQVTRHTTIPDDKEIIIETFAESMACTPLVIATGGLGPTLDDMTRQAAAELFESPLEYNEEIAELLQQQFGDFPTLRDEATVPKKALILPNPAGTACGLIFSASNSIVILLPGVPLETQFLMVEQIIPFLKRTFLNLSAHAHDQLHFAHLYESQVDPLLRSLNELDHELKFGIYPTHGLLSVSVEGGNGSVKMAVEALEKQFADYRFIAPDGKIETAVKQAFLEKSLTLATAESCTGGALAARLTSVPGASSYFLGSVVAYTSDFKEKFLDIPHELIRKHGAISPEVTGAMAEAIHVRTNSSFAVAITGIAGPAGGTVDNPIGTIHIALKKAGEAVENRTLHVPGIRAVVIERAVNYVLGWIYQNLISWKK